VTLKLVGLSYSPWTEKARWALDHHRLAFRFEEHVPMLGEAKLRFRLRRLRGRATVPVLFDGQGPLADSFQIMLYADRIGAGAPLVPAGRLEEVSRWNDRSESALRAARAIVVAKTSTSPEAKVEALPALVPGVLRPALRGVADLGLGFFRLKYGLASAAGAEEAARALREVLLHLRAGLGGRRYLLGAFSYADIAMAVTLQPVRPVEHRAIRLRPATRAVWSDPELAAEFGDLVAWRDALYAEHRGP
jgi:glutathione S-transferase